MIDPFKRLSVWYRRFRGIDGYKPVTEVPTHVLEEQRKIKERLEFAERILELARQQAAIEQGRALPEPHQGRTDSG